MVLRQAPHGRAAHDIGKPRHSPIVHWFNNRRLLEPIGNIPPAEAEDYGYASLAEPAMAK